MPEPPSFTIMWNPTLFLSNNLAFSFEYKKKKNAVELELGYIYPFFGPPYSAYGGNTLDVNFPTGCYNGISANIFLKRYWRQHFYYGLSALFKYEYFKNTWIEDGNNVYSYDVNCSQTREVFGLAFRCGWRFAGKYITWVPYLAGGVRLLNSKTTYNYFTEDGGKGLNYGLPPDDGILFDDNGIALVPYINFGIKVGFGWNGKK
jgi:hypothetical protein